MSTDNPYQSAGLPLIQHFWPYGEYWPSKLRQKWIAWNWKTGSWDTLYKPEVKK